MDWTTEVLTTKLDLTTTEKPYSRYGDGEFLVFFLATIFLLIFIAYMYKLSKWCRTQTCGTSQTLSPPNTSRKLHLIEWNQDSFYYFSSQ